MDFFCSHDFCARKDAVCLVESLLTREHQSITVHLRPTFPVIAFFCLGIWAATIDDQASCEISQASETVQLLQEENANTISFEDKVAFISPNGEEITLSIGTYQVEAIDLTALRLVPFGAKSVFVIKAEQTKHNEDIGFPVALLVVDEQYLIHVVLLLPEQKALEAIGYSRLGRFRGMHELLTPAQIHDALARRKAALGQHNPGTTSDKP